MKRKVKRLLVYVLTIVFIFHCFTAVADAVPEATEEATETSIRVENVESIGDKTILYVANNGKDTNAGTIDKPFASLEKARDTIRTLKKAGKLGKDGAVVYVRGGEYLIQQALELTAEDSGTNDAPIVYRNYPEEQVKFMGSVNLSSDSFKKVTDEAVLERLVDSAARKKLVAVDMFALGYKSLPEQTWPGAYSYIYGMEDIHGKTTPEAIASELIIDGVAMTTARYPNEEYLTIETVIEPGANVRMWRDDQKGNAGYVPPEERKPTPFVITVDDNRVDMWTQAKDALMYGYFGYSWADQTVPLASVNPSKNALTAKYPSVYQAFAGQHFYVYNLLEEIDIPGEYFIDREEGMLYLYPPEGGIGTAMFTSLEDYMFRLTDTEYVTIKGIDMGYMRNGAIKASNVKCCEISDCEINYTGKRAILLDGYDNRVYDCYIYDVEGGITVSGGDRPTLTPGNNIVENCEFEECARITNAYMPAIILQGCGNKAVNNALHGADHNIMQMSGNDHTVAYNEIYDACRFADDMAALYTGRAVTQRGNRIIHNYFHDIGSPDLGKQGVHGIFLDDYWSAAKIENNVFENITGYGAMFAGGNNEANNNIFINVQSGAIHANRSYTYSAEDAATSTGYVYAFNNDLASVPWQSELWLSRYPEMANIDPSVGKYGIAENISICNNVSYNSGTIKVLPLVEETGTIENNISYGSDPGFYDLENRNYLLKEDSDVYKKLPDFKPILFTRMGQYSERALARVKKAYALCAESPYILKNGELVKSERVGATVVDGKIYIPLRTATEIVGGTINFDEATNEVSVSTAAKQISFIDGATDKINVNGTEFALTNKIVNIDYTNYISAEDIAVVFEKQLVQKGYTVIFSDIENLFTDDIDDELIRYIQAQLTVY